MAFRTTTPDEVQAVAYARQSSASEVLEHLNYLADTFIMEDRPYDHGDVFQTYKITITIEPA